MSKTIDQNKLYNFTKKWLEELQPEKYNFYNVFDNTEFSNECFDIGFEMDCGKSFSCKYGNLHLIHLKNYQR